MSIKSTASPTPDLEYQCVMIIRLTWFLSSSIHFYCLYTTEMPPTVEEEVDVITPRPPGKCKRFSSCFFLFFFCHININARPSLKDCQTWSSGIFLPHFSVVSQVCGVAQMVLWRVDVWLWGGHGHLESQQPAPALPSAPWPWWKMPERHKTRHGHLPVLAFGADMLLLWVADTTGETEPIKQLFTPIFFLIDLEIFKVKKIHNRAP